MNKKQLDLELYLYILIFGVSLLVRILLLGKAPLSVSESGLAYQAWELAQGQDVHLGSQVGYLTLTEMLFSLLGSGNAIARFFFFFFGSFLIWVPFFFRFQLGRKAALVIALGLALDPGMVAASRVVGGKMMAVTFFLLALGMLWNGKRFWAVFFGGMAILSGPFFWMGILGAVITFGIVSSLGFVESPLQIWKGISKSDSSGQEGKIPWYLILGLGLIILIGTSFLQHYQGFSAWTSSLPAFLTGWFQYQQPPPGSCPPFFYPAFSENYLFH